MLNFPMYAHACRWEISGINEISNQKPVGISNNNQWHKQTPTRSPRIHRSVQSTAVANEIMSKLIVRRLINSLDNKIAKLTTKTTEQKSKRKCNWCMFYMLPRYPLTSRTTYMSWGDRFTLVFLTLIFVSFLLTCKSI